MTSEPSMWGKIVKHYKKPLRAMTIPDVALLIYLAHDRSGELAVTVISGVLVWFGVYALFKTVNLSKIDKGTHYERIMDSERATPHVSTAFRDRRFDT